jgi:hypothetical protein
VVNNIRYYRCMEETYDIVLGVRVSARMNDKILAEQQRLTKMTGGIKPSINEIVRMLLERGLEASRPRRIPSAGRRR